MNLGPGVTRLLLAMVVFFSHFSSFAIGAPAVSAFFALSGYWIAGLWDQQPGAGLPRYGAFVVSRWLRLAPLLFIAIIGQVVINASLGLPLPAIGAPHWWLSQGLIAGSSASSLVLQQQWSLDVEMQFYLTAPFLAMLAGKLPRVPAWLLVGGLLATGALLFQTGTAPSAATLLPHLGFFLAGMLCRRHSPMPWARELRWLPIIVIVALIALPDLRPLLSWRHVTDASPPATHIHRALLLFAIGIAFLPLVLGTVRHASSNLDRLIGDLAYPVYLFHEWFRSIVYHMRPEDASLLHKLLDTSLALFGTMAISAALLWLVDRPVQRWRRRQGGAAATPVLLPA
jgi:peptidoglycan/LPS O-acetylase OafA/YrhL